MKIYGLGRLTKDVELRYSQGSEAKAFATFGIACERKFKVEGEPEADFFDCVAFGSKADFIAKYFGKGSKVFVEGEIRNDNYTNKEGVKIYRNRIYVSDVEFADSKKETVTSEPAPVPAAQTQPKTNKAGQVFGKGARASKTAATQSQGDGFMNIPDGLGDELPFLN